jgi:hypothetical protein
MRPPRDLMRIVAAVGAGLLLAACGAASNHAGGTESHDTSGTAANGATVTVSKSATGAVPDSGTGTAPRPVGSSSPAAGTHATTTAVTTGQYGNPGGTAVVPPAGRAVPTAHPARVIGTGTPASCTSAAVVAAVAKGGIITFNCGPAPVTITMTATAKVVNTHRRTVLDGGGKVTLSGGGKVRILYQNTCDPKQIYTTSDCWEQQWPQLVVQNLTFTNAYSAIRQTKTSNYGGGAIFVQGGQLKVVNTGFINNRCYRFGPDLGGAAIRALGMWQGSPVYITRDTFRGGRCSNGGALSSIAAKWDVFNSVFLNNRAIGWGQNPQQSGTPGGGSGGAIYTDGNSYSVLVAGTIMRNNDAREGGGAIFFVVDNGPGTLTIRDSRLHANPSGQFQNAPGIFDSVDGHDVPPVVINSTVN